MEAKQLTRWFNDINYVHIVLYKNKIDDVKNYIVNLYSDLYSVVYCSKLPEHIIR